MNIDWSSIEEMTVCHACGDVVGWFWRENRGPFLQGGRCGHHRQRPDAPLWPGFDFNQGVDLCYCCGVEPLRSGSRWSVWFCDECKEQVGLLNARHGRCVVPIGRHSVHWGWTLKREDLADAVVVESFLEAARAATAASTALGDWHELAVRMNIEEIAAAPFAPVPIQTYHRRASARVDRMERFREMCAYLDRRGREMIGACEGAAG